MKKLKKLTVSAAALGMVVLSLFGCGKREEQQNNTKDYVWVSEYADFNVEKCDWIDNVVSLGDECFFSTSFYDEEKEASVTNLYKYDLLENKAEKLNFGMEENSSIYGMAVNADGNLAMLINQYEYIKDDEGNVTDVNSKIQLGIVSPSEGAMIDSNEITEVLGVSQDTYIQSFCVDAQGNLYFADGDSKIYVLNADMQKICEITLDGWINDMVASKEGDVYIAAYGNEGMELRKVDIAAKKTGEPVGGLMEGYGNFSFHTGINQSLLISSNKSVLTFDIPSQTQEELFKWIDVDINSEDVNQAGELSDGRIWAIIREYDKDYNASYQLAYLTKKDASEVAARQEIVFGAMWMDSDVKRNIIK